MGFDVKALQSRLVGRRIDWRLHFLDTVDSTNRVALDLARKGAPEGTIVLADCQTAGRGRLHRAWQSPPGCNLYASLLIRPEIDPADAPQLTLMAGVAAEETLSALCPEGVGLKWPNDVLIRGRKVCGILTELRMAGGAVAAVVVGIGVNVNMPRADFDPAYRETATSLREETGQEQSREEVAFRLCESFEKWYETFRCEGFSPVREDWLARSEMPGRRVRVLFRDEAQEGRVIGIDHDGALLIADDLGATRRVTAGDADIMKG
ncbi:MAG: biotin--[acetyl-CoA-carboxylase] ligase [Proteobacteria bacterium]|nr:biotin--[acetyl-CoA-carboxylase] ligase [Pseudomonadota bacterium]MBU2228593.1 biotin--[acetyl-CoA-carboxylase] ligase [Pseudomonadota bacterium]MBU2261777.1 biotin--[acetyl-CoA-carboxylase] ligase [Pseudomonadota bacterium]